MSRSSKRSSWTPYDLPFAVYSLADAYEQALASWQADFTAGRNNVDQEKLDDFQYYVTRSERMLRDSPMDWLDKSVCRVVGDILDGVPAWSADAAAPADSGVVGFERSLVHLPAQPADGAEEVGIDAFAWYRDADSNCFRVSLLTRAALPEIKSKLRISGSHLCELLSVDIPLKNPQGAGETEIILSANTPEVADTYNHLITARVYPMVGTTWLLMGQEQIVEEDETTQVKVRARGGAGVGKPGSSTTVRRQVRVTTRTLSRRQRSSGSGGSGGASGREATSRWWVRGHWRQQPYGKGSKQRRPVFIAPHTAGAREENSPTDTRPQVRIWRQ